MDKRLVGAYGELYTGKFLMSKGWRILANNYHCRMGEIDLIATDGKYICFIEVKTREENSMFQAKEAVDEIKQRKIIATSQFFLARHKTRLQPRFDVAEVYMRNDEAVAFNYIKNAFSS